MPIVMIGILQNGRNDGPKFTVADCGDGRYQVVITNQKTGNDVDDATLWPSEIGDWLLNRIDY